MIARKQVVAGAETRATLVASIARGRRWLDEIVAGTVTGVEQIAARDKCSIRQVNMTISRDAPVEWSRQYAMLGLPI